MESGLKTPIISKTEPDHSTQGQRRNASHKKSGEDQKTKERTNMAQGSKNKQTSAKLRGLEKDSPAVRLSKTLSWLLRHGAKSEGLPMRADGYTAVTDLLANPKVKSQALDLAGLQEIVKADAKQRYHLMEDSQGVWWIRANQGHSIQTVKLELKPILSVKDIPTGIAVHGTSRKAWDLISKGGLSRMKRNHIHLAQGIPGDNVISGMRNSSQIFIFIDVQRAIDAGIPFYLSDNGVVLTEGDETGILPCQFFQRVENEKRAALHGWEVADRSDRATEVTEPLAPERVLGPSPV